MRAGALTGPAFMLSPVARGDRAVVETKVISLENIVRDGW
jgi:predicted short-subunit dehydrogenase-like oxidoreductase (DUF2520 family)